MELNRVDREQVKVGTKLPWNVYNSEGRLLLRKDYLIQHNSQIDHLLEAGLFRIINSAERKPTVSLNTPKEYFAYLCQRISKIHDNIIARQHVEKDILLLTSEIQRTVKLNSNAMIAAFHLYADGHYTSVAPVKLAVITELIGLALDMDDLDRQLIMAAALTANIGMREIQDDLVGYALPLNEEQLIVIKKHPEQSVKLLIAAGIRDKIWLRMVFEHHEQMDGGGYPKGLMRSKIAEGSLLLGIAEIYVGMISERLYRTGMRAKDALRALFMDRGRRIDEHTVQVLVKSIGIYPPGSVVRLYNQEIALVVLRRENTTTPLVKAVSNPRDGIYPKPITRDTRTREYTIVDILDKASLVGHQWEDLFAPIRHSVKKI